MQKITIFRYTRVSLTGVNRTEVGGYSKEYRGVLYRFFLYEMEM